MLESESESCSVMSDSLWPHGLYRPWNSPDQNTGVGHCSLLQGIFPAQGSNPGLPHCRQILSQLSHKGSPFICYHSVTRQAPLSVGFSRQEYWSGLPFPPPGDLPNPGIEPMSPALAGGFFTTEPPGKSNIMQKLSQ